MFLGIRIFKHVLEGMEFKWRFVSSSSYYVLNILHVLVHRVNSSL